MSAASRANPRPPRSTKQEGIGGVFDLTDSLVLAAPVAYLCLRPLLG